MAKLLAHKPQGWLLACQDESIFHYEVTLKKVWALKGSQPRTKVTGSKAKTCVYGTLTEDGRQLFRQYPTCNSAYFIKYLKLLVRKYTKVILIIDRAPWHTSKKTTHYVNEQSRRLRILWFPTGFPESDPVEECWHQGKYDDNLGAKFHASYDEFKQAVAAYYRTRRFNLDMLKYLCH